MKYVNIIGSWLDRLAIYLLIFLQLCVVDLSDLSEFGPVVRMFDGVVCSPTRGHRRGCSSCGSAAFLWPGHALCQQHIVQAHELGVRRILLLGTTNAETCSENTHKENKGSASAIQDGMMESRSRSKNLLCLPDVTFPSAGMN